MIKIIKYKKIVVINCDGIGDVMLSTPTLMGLRKNFPDSKISLIVNPVVLSLAQKFNFVDTVIPYKKGMNLLNVIKKIWRYDLAVCLDGRHRSSEIPALALVKTRVGAANAISIATNTEDGIFSLKRGLLLNKKVYLDGSEYHKYQAENLAKIVERGLNIDLKIDYTRLCPPQIDNRIINKVEKLLNIETEDSILAISPFSSGTWKDWPIPKYIEFMRRLHENNPKIKFIILGSKENKKVKIDYPDFVDLRGKTDLSESAYLLKRADCFIGGCSAMLHIASAMSTMCIALYGATSSQQYAPKNNTIIIQAVAKGNNVIDMDTITVDEVLLNIKSFSKIEQKIRNK